MKAHRFLSLLLAAMLCMGLFGCSSKSQPVSADELVSADEYLQTAIGKKEIVYAEQTDFLKDMAAGIKARLADANTDVSSMSKEELAKYYKKLVDCELKQIRKYQENAFLDEKFNDLAHRYIEACILQESAVNSIRNEALHSALWDAGSQARSAIIVHFYETYDLDLSAEEVASYRSGTTAGYSISVDDSSLPSWLSGSSNDVSLKQGQLVIEKASGTIQQYTNSANYKYTFTVKNDSGSDLTSISVNCAILDKNDNVLGSTSAYVHVTIPDGKSANCEGSFSLTEYPEAKYLEIDHLSYDGNGDHVIHNLPARDSDVKKFRLEIK